MDKSISDLAEAVSLATAELKDSELRYMAASRDRTEMINRLNKAQREFDVAIDALKKDAPRESDWNRPKGHQT